MPPLQRKNKLGRELKPIWIFLFFLVFFFLIEYTSLRGTTKKNEKPLLPSSLSDLHAVT